MTFKESKDFMKMMKESGLVFKGKTENELLDEYQIWWDKNMLVCQNIGLPRNPQIVYNTKK